MWYFMFEDDVTGESFFVECDELVEAIATAAEYFDEPHYICRCDECESMIWGYDVY